MDYERNSLSGMNHFVKKERVNNRIIWKSMFITFSKWFDLSVQIRLACWRENFSDCETWLSLLLLLLLMMVIISYSECWL